LFVEIRRHEGKLILDTCQRFSSKKKSRLDNNKTEVYFNFFLVEIA